MVAGASMPIDGAGAGAGLACLRLVRLKKGIALSCLTCVALPFYGSSMGSDGKGRMGIW